MVAAYAVLHFGKPVGETISAVFGGYLLGVLAFYSKNIWGGALVHVTLAGCVELFAYLLG
jgi:membrane protease YdiL (CAAX protease family)